jgi:hypothetical protein
MQHRAAPSQPPGPAPVPSAGLDLALATGLGTVAAGLGEELGDGLGEGLGDGLGEGLGDRLGVELGDGLGEGLGDGLGEGLGDGLGEEVGDGQADRLGLAIGPTLGVGLALAFGLGQALGLGHGPGLAAAAVAQWAGAALLWCFLPCPVPGAAPPVCAPPLTPGPPVPTTGPPPSTVWISETACANTCPGTGVNTKAPAIAMKAARLSAAAGRHAGWRRPDRAARNRSRAVPGTRCSHSHAVCSPPRAQPATSGNPVVIQATGVECGAVSRARIRFRPSSAGSMVSASACNARRSISPKSGSCWFKPGSLGRFASPTCPGRCGS